MIELCDNKKKLSKLREPKPFGNQFNCPYKNLVEKVAKLARKNKRNFYNAKLQNEGTVKKHWGIINEAEDRKVGRIREVKIDEQSLEVNGNEVQIAKQFEKHWQKFLEMLSMVEFLSLARMQKATSISGSTQLPPRRLQKLRKNCRTNAVHRLMGSPSRL